jgi:hypothetical protein
VVDLELECVEPAERPAWVARRVQGNQVYLLVTMLLMRKTRWWVGVVTGMLQGRMCHRLDTPRRMMEAVGSPETLGRVMLATIDQNSRRMLVEFLVAMVVASPVSVAEQQG